MRKVVSKARGEKMTRRLSYARAVRLGLAVAAAMIVIGASASLGLADSSLTRDRSPSGASSRPAVRNVRRHRAPRYPSSNAYVQTLVGEWRRSLGDLGGAKEDLEIALVYDPYSAFLALELAEITWNTGSLVDVEKWVNRSIELRPNRAQAWLLKGDVAMCAKDRRAARHAFEAAKRVEPHSSAARIAAHRLGHLASFEANPHATPIALAATQSGQLLALVGDPAWALFAASLMRVRQVFDEIPAVNMRPPNCGVSTTSSEQANAP